MRPGLLFVAAVVLVFTLWRWRRRGTEGRVLGIGAAAVLLVLGTGLVHLPNIEHLIKDIGSTLGRWTYLLVAVMAFLETGAFVGLIAPGEFTILLGGVVAGQGEINVVVLIGLVWACAVAGDCVSFYLGGRLGRGFMVKHGPKVKITEPRLEQVERFFERHGGKTILIGRFVGLVRAIAPFIAGASKMRFARFLPFDIIGAGLWGTTLVLLGYIFWHSFDKVAAIAGRGAFALGAVIAAMVGGIAAYRWLKDPANRERLGAWVAEQERKPVVGPLFRVGRRVYEGAVRPTGRALAGPARFLWSRITPGELGLELTTLLAVALVGSFVFGGLASIVHGAPLNSDRRTFDLVSDLNNHHAIDVAKIVTALGSLEVVAPLVVLAVLFLLARRRILEGVVIASGLVLTAAGVHIAKLEEGRPRPTGGLVDSGGSSFPSGHAAYAIALIAVAVAFRHAMPGLLGRFAAVGVAVALAAAIGATRIYLHVHYLSDVLAGFGLAACIFSVCGMVGLIVAFMRHNEADRPA